MSSSQDTRIYRRSAEREPARMPAEPARAQSEPHPRFAAGGTQILGAPAGIRSTPSALAQTQHFAVEQLLSRRADLTRELEQQLNRELEQELAMLTTESEIPPRAEESQQSLEVRTRPAKPRKIWLRLCMLGLLLASVAMLLYKPAAELAPAPQATPLPATLPMSEGPAPTPVATPTPAVALGPHTTLQRAAADVIAEGRYADALSLYRQLAETEPESPAYAEVVQILEHRLRTTTKLDSAQR